MNEVWLVEYYWERGLLHFEACETEDLAIKRRDNFMLQQSGSSSCRAIVTNLPILNENEVLSKHKN